MLIMVSHTGFLTAAEPHLYISFSRLVEAIGNSIVTEMRVGFQAEMMYTTLYVAT